MWDDVFYNTLTEALPQLANQPASGWVRNDKPYHTYLHGDTPSLHGGRGIYNLPATVLILATIRILLSYRFAKISAHLYRLMHSFVTNCWALKVAGLILPCDYGQPPRVNSILWNTHFLIKLQLIPILRGTLLIFIHVDLDNNTITVCVEQ